jgi:hypothetical protein
VHDQDVVLLRERGFEGKPITSIFGLGVSSRIARSSSAKKSTPGVMRTERMSAPAMIAP